MSIRVDCPNGHTFKVRDEFAGKHGLCPTCKARLVVPQPHAAPMSEDAIMSILGPATPHVANAKAVAPHDEHHAVAAAATPRQSPPKKSCNHCNREIPTASRICPFCRKYIANLADGT
jgi:hypothetical protein